MICCKKNSDWRTLVNNFFFFKELIQCIIQMHSNNLIIYIDWNAVVKVVQLFTINYRCLYFGRKKMELGFYLRM